MRRLPPMGALEAFVAVAQLQTLRAAAEALNLSVSALSRRVQALESHVGKPLFERLHHEFRLTDDGRWLLERAGPAFDTLGRALADLRASGDHMLRIGVPPSFATAWLLPRLQRFRAAHPDIDFSFDSTGAPFSKLGSSLDAIIVFAEQVDGDFYAGQLKPQQAFAVAAPGLVPPGTTPRQCLENQVILLHRGLPRVLPVWLAGMGLTGLEPRRTDYFDNGPMLVAAAENRLGVALTLADTVRFLPGAPVLERPFGESIASTYSYWFVSRRSALAGRALRCFHDWLFAEAAGDHEAHAA